jgi:hypothetical protein
MAWVSLRRPRRADCLLPTPSPASRRNPPTLRAKAPSRLVQKISIPREPRPADPAVTAPLIGQHLPCPPPAPPPRAPPRLFREGRTRRQNAGACSRIFPRPQVSHPRSAQAEASPLCAVPKRAHRPKRVRCARFKRSAQAEASPLCAIQKKRTGRSESVVRVSSEVPEWIEEGRSSHWKCIRSNSSDPHTRCRTRSTLLADSRSPAVITQLAFLGSRRRSLALPSRRGSWAGSNHGSPESAKPGRPAASRGYANCTAALRAGNEGRRVTTERLPGASQQTPKRSDHDSTHAPCAEAVGRQAHRDALDSGP